MASEGPPGPLDFDPDAEDEGGPARAPRSGPDTDGAGSGPMAAPSRGGLPAVARGSAWVVGVVGVVVVALRVLGTFGAGGGPGGERVAAGGQAPPFAAPLALSALAAGENSDVNVAVKAGQGEAGRVPACSVRRPDVLNVCALYERGPVVLAFFSVRSAECLDQVDRLDALAGRHPEVAVAAVSLGGNLGDVRRAVRERGWRLPVGWDHDAILAGAYGAPACPQLTFLRRGGRVESTNLGVLEAQQLEARVRRLAR